MMYSLYGYELLFNIQYCIIYIDINHLYNLLYNILWIIDYVCIKS